MFSVVIPYYKKKQYIERCINAVLNQTCKDFEIIVVDDGSNDDLAELIQKKYQEKVILISQENQGVSVARNTGIAKASHDYIAFLDADDYWSPFYLQKAEEIITNEKEVKIIGSLYSKAKNEIESQNKKIQYYLISDYFKNALRNMLFFTSATIVKKHFFTNNSDFNPKLKYGEDLDIWFRVMLSKGKAFYIENILVYYSNEDINQATKQKAKLEDAISAQMFILYPDEMLDAKFKEFANKYVYTNLYKAYFSDHNHILASKILKQITKRYFLADIYYKIPYKLGEKLMRNSKVRKLARNYFKFLFRNIYN